MVIIVIILIFLAFVYVGLPLWAKLIVFIINSFLPDPIPVVDEVLMVAAIINDILKLYKVMAITEWIRSHKVLALCIGLGIIILFGVGISFLFSHIGAAN